MTAVRVVGSVLVHDEDVFVEQAIRNVAEVCDRIHAVDHLSRDRTPAIFLTLGRIAQKLGEPVRRLLVGVVRKLERYVPEDPAIREFIASLHG